MKTILTIMIFLVLYAPCWGMTEQEGVDTVVAHLRTELMKSEEWQRWDREFADWWTIQDLREDSLEFRFRFPPAEWRGNTATLFPLDCCRDIIGPWQRDTNPRSTLAR